MQKLTASEYADWYKFYLSTPFGPHIDAFYGAQTSHTMVALWGKRAQPLEKFHPQVKPKKRQSIEEQREILWAMGGKKDDG